MKVYVKMIGLNYYPHFEEKTYIIDASNICALLINEKSKFKLYNLILTVLELLQRGVKRENIIIIADANLRYKIDLPIKYSRLVKTGMIQEAPAGVQADELILAYCLEHKNALFISNDLMRQFRSQLPHPNWIVERRVAVANIKGDIYLIPMQKVIFKTLARKKITNANKRKSSYEGSSEKTKIKVNKKMEMKQISIKSTLDVFKNIKSSEGEFDLFSNSEKGGEK